MVGGILIVWTILMFTYGTFNPFYVVASSSMVPALEVDDLLVISAHEPFREVNIGDIIVYNRPSDHNRVIVHRIIAVLDDDPWTLRAKGDANPASMPGTDFPITEEEYLGTVVHVIPDVGIIPKFVQPPVNYIIIAGVVGYIIIKQIKSKKENKRPPEGG